MFIEVTAADLDAALNDDSIDPTVRAVKRAFRRWGFTFKRFDGANAFYTYRVADREYEGHLSFSGRFICLNDLRLARFLRSPMRRRAYLMITGDL